MTRSDAPLWLARAKRSRPPARPRLRGEVRADVAVVGGGLTGCLSAYLIARGGLTVVLVEASRVGEARTATSTGRLTPGPGAPFTDLQQRHGLRVARHMWESSRLAVLEFASLLRRLRIRCDLETVDAVDVAVNQARADAIEREYRALRDAGFEATWLPPPRVRQALGLDAAAAMRMPGAATIDPFRACVAIARQAERAGAALFEQTRATRVRAQRDRVEVVTEGGVLQAGTVVVATDAPGREFAALGRHVRALDRFVVALPPMTTRSRRPFGHLRAIARDQADPAHEWHWTGDGRLVLSGGDQPAVLPKQRETARIRRGGQLMYELSLLYPHVSGTRPDACWIAGGARSADGVMLTGPHRHFPRHVFALATGEGGVGTAALAARIVARRVLGAPEKGDEMFGFGR